MESSFQRDVSLRLGGIFFDRAWRRAPEMLVSLGPQTQVGLERLDPQETTHVKQAKAPDICGLEHHVICKNCATIDEVATGMILGSPMVAYGLPEGGRHVAIHPVGGNHPDCRVDDDRGGRGS